MSAARERITSAIVRHAKLRVRDWWLLVVVAAAQIAVAASLRILPLSAWRSGTGRPNRVARLLVNEPDERLVWAIEATGRRLGRFSTCLVRALVAQLVLNSDDGPVSLTIGVRHNSGGAFEAHAWVTRRDCVLIGATGDEYLPIVTWTRQPA
jgi:anti-sigma-K factor RskA